MPETASISTNTSHIWNYDDNLISFDPEIRRSEGSSYILRLPDDRYSLMQPIPVSITTGDDGDYIACFNEAHICMTGKSKKQAKDDLSHYILDVFEILMENEDRLGKGPKSELAVLRRHILI